MRHHEPDHRLVIVEGLYLLFDDWGLHDLFDLRIFIDCPQDEAARRLIRRHLASGLARTEQEARSRIDQNDRLNAKLIEEDGCRERADVVIRW